MQISSDSSDVNDSVGGDLGPLAWVLDELRKSLEGATKAIRRYVRDAEKARGTGLESLDTAQLRIASQQLHQAVGALEMVGQVAPAKMLRAMESLVQKFAQHPEFCSEVPVAMVERSSFALTQFLEGVLRSKSASAVALFPQYREILKLIDEDRVHPADLCPIEWHWTDLQLSPTSDPVSYGAAVRSKLDSAMLNMVKTGSVSSAKTMRDISLSLAASQQKLEPRAFWQICAAFFEVFVHKLCPLDVYAKRTASRVLLQYSTLAKDNQELSARLVQDLLFFCAQAVPKNTHEAPTLAACRETYGLAKCGVANYEAVQFGRFDPALLTQLRKRIATATETWAALSGGDTNRLRVVAEQFNAVSDAILKLHPENKDIAKALVKAVEHTVRAGQPPATPVGMEVATAILYLDAAYEDMDPTDTRMAERSLRLAQRLDYVITGGPSEPLEGWMEDIYRGVSDRQTMGSVVNELRNTLNEAENSLDRFFRDPKDKEPLQDVPAKFAQMRGVFSVLGLDQASLATVRMRDSVNKLLIEKEGANPAAQSQLFEKLGNSLGALGFLVDMLSYQRVLAKKLFTYDEDRGEFISLMGRKKDAEGEMKIAISHPQPAVMPEEVGVPQALTDKSTLAGLPQAQSDAPVGFSTEKSQIEADDDAELRDIFLEEVREVVANALETIKTLVSEPQNAEHLTSLRRAFHTLKGSSRMVGLNEFGEAAWGMEQLLNHWLAEQKPANESLLRLSHEAMQGMGRWVDDIAQGQDERWSSAPFRQAADSLRSDNQYMPVGLPDDALPVQNAQSTEPAEHEVQAEDVSHNLTSFQMTEMFGLEATHGTSSPAGAGLESMNFSNNETNFPLTDVFDFDLTEVMTDEPQTHAVAAQDAASNETQFPFGEDFDFEVAEDIKVHLPTPLPQVELEAVETELPDIFEPLDETALSTMDAEVELQEPMSVSTLDEPMDQPPAVQIAEEQVKVIGPLRIGIPLYNVYLNEADEWSRRLQTELNEWSLELHKPLSDTSIALAHSLGGSSATVGFMALSKIARLLEQALQHVQLHGRGWPEHAEIFIAAADSIRHLLHQFAAGFLKEPDAELMQLLEDVLAMEFQPSVNFDIHDDIQEEKSGLASSVQESVPAPEPIEMAQEPVHLAVIEEAPALVVPLQAEPVFAIHAPMGAAQIVLDGQDDDIDAEDSVDADLFPIFEEEADELLPKLSGALRKWAVHPEDLGARSEVLRVLHTLKGSARLAGAMRMGEMSHHMESAVEHMGTEFLQSSQIEPLLARFDALQQDFDDLRAGVARAEIEALQPSVSAPIETVDDPVLAVSQGAPEVPMFRAVNHTVAHAPVRQTGGHFLRVRSQLLDRLLNQAGEVMITRSRLDARLGQMRGSLTDLTGNLERLRQQLREIELQAESQMQSRLTLTKDSAQGFDPLEFDRFTQVQELTRMMAESVNDVATVQRHLQSTIAGTEDDLIAQGRQARELQRDLLRTRMVEFESISERLYGVVRQASKDTHKQVKLDITGGSIEMDRGVLDRMAPAFEHMLRNAVAHGIEDSELRHAAGKAAAGNIAITLHHEGNDVSVTFSDDGAGLNLVRIREKAKANGLVPDNVTLSDADASNLIFTPGFSTAAQVTELAGRGIGMDVVQTEVNALGGRIETTTELGAGTSFKLVLPLTTAVTQVVMLRMGSLSIGVPANLVEVVKRVSAADLAKAYQAEQIEHNGETMPLYWGGALFQASTRSVEMIGKTQPVVVFRSAGQRLAAHVDEVLGNQEVVVKNLGPQLSRLPGLSGMSVLASGAVVLIYNPVALTTFYGEQVRSLEKSGRVTSVDRSSVSGAEDRQVLKATVGVVPLVLVVDDSITVRRVTQRLLKREGYRVALASDGRHALEVLQEERPTIVVSDIEMPRMDGFELARYIRADPRLHDLPIVMITSRMAEKHREHALQLGVNHYLGKPYNEEELLGLVQHYAKLAVEA
jgi:chemosensory pili system protein ChpA (sensor histidine kinase/response regulator)